MYDSSAYLQMLMSVLSGAYPQPQAAPYYNRSLGPKMAQQVAMQQARLRTAAEQAAIRARGQAGQRPNAPAPGMTVGQMLASGTLTRDQIPGYISPANMTDWSNDAIAIQKRREAEIASRAPGGLLAERLAGSGTSPLASERMARRASGGSASGISNLRGASSRGPAIGLLRSAVPGRTDRLPIQVWEDSYVVPADVVSGWGQGNTEAGAKILDAMFESHAKNGFARGGRAQTLRQVPIVAAGGEYVVHPHAVWSLGGGDMREGHKKLDKMVRTKRKATARHNMRLPGPRID